MAKAEAAGDSGRREALVGGKAEGRQRAAGDGGRGVGAMLCHVPWRCHCVIVRWAALAKKEFENNFKNQLNHGLSNLEMKFENLKVLLLRRFLT